MTEPSNRWVVRRSGFPFGAPGDVLASVIADDRRQAEELAHDVFGRSVIIEPSRPVEAAALDAAALHARAMRIMTPIEIQMARALGVLRINGPAKGTVRRLHAESFKPSPEISDQLAAKLRQIVHQHRSQLPPEVIESVGGAP